MKYDANFPLKTNNHVIIDRRSGAQYFSTRHSAVQAMTEHVKSVTEEDFKALTADQKKSLLDFTRGVTMFMLGAQLPEYGDTIVAGPFETQSACLHEKNLVLGIEIIRKNDSELAEWLDKELADFHAKNDAAASVSPDSPDEKISSALESAITSALGLEPGSVKAIRLNTGGGISLEDLLGGGDSRKLN